MQDLLVRGIDSPTLSGKRVVAIEEPAMKADSRTVISAGTELTYGFKYGKTL